MASCGYMLIVKETAGVSAETQARLIQGLVAGIGFIGGDAILKESGYVSGLATAASIWNTGAIGVAIASDREEVNEARLSDQLKFDATLLPTNERLPRYEQPFSFC